MKRYFTMIVLLLGITGCVPKTHPVSPTIVGRIVDARTKQPLSDVEIGSVLTDDKGYFMIKGEKELGIGTPMGGMWKVPSLIVRVSKTGYKTMYCSCDALSTEEGCINVTVLLYPVGISIANDIRPRSHNGFECHMGK